MIEIGKTHSLKVTKHVDFGVYLEGDDLEEILLPERYLPEDEDAWDIGQFLSVFIYLDSEDRPIATTETPLAEVGDCACLTVVGKSEFGAFLDWGLMKDLLVPFKEQRVPMEVGRSYVVYLYLDVTGRIAASSLLSRHLPEVNDGMFSTGQEVDLMIGSRSDLGYKAIINGSHLGLIHNNEIVRPITIGDEFKGYIGEAREDGRLNITLQKPSLEMRGELADIILAYLKDNDGQSRLTDKSPPDDIYATFHVSKSNFKKALGKLYKARKIKLEDGQIILIQK
ncbi:MAG: GntR family transcriptional regulator [Alphaproteobacteria bacterium]|nr:GntR family transcriptional regulator [Alphaproteobacteria bacterium]